ncbi:unnamed protein product [Urochloa decumbens]|uniref:Uncharacterized protein n=1 Tax=Urochloa decumbens TaxID=240449 RepID=A0ABC8Y8A7_9POAL
MEGAMLIAAAIAAVAVYRLYRIRLADATSGRRAISVALAVTLLFNAGVLLSAVVSSSTSRNIALRVEETETKLLQMEEIIRGYQKQNPGNIKSMSYNRDTSPDCTEKADPLTKNGHTCGIMEAAPKVNDEAAPVADTPAPLQGEAMEAQKQKPWRGFLIPPDRVFVLDCVGDELKVRIRPHLDGESIRAAGAASCRSRQKPAEMLPFLYRCGPDYTLFMSPPGEQRVVPVPWPRPEMYQKLTTAKFRGEESPIAEETEAVPDSFTLTPDVAAFYYQTKHGMTAMIIVETDTVERTELTEEVAAQAVTAFYPLGVIPISFPDLCIST